MPELNVPLTDLATTEGVDFSYRGIPLLPSLPEHYTNKKYVDDCFDKVLEVIGSLGVGGGTTVIQKFDSPPENPPQLAAPVIVATQTTSGYKTASLYLEWEETARADRYLVEWAGPQSDQWNSLSMVTEPYYNYVNYLSGVPLRYKFRVTALSDGGLAKSPPSEAILLTSPPHIALSLTAISGNTVHVKFNEGRLATATEVQLWYRYEGDFEKKFQMLYSGLATSYRHTSAKYSTNREVSYKNIYYIKIFYPSVGKNTSYAVSEVLGIDTHPVS